MVWTLALWRRFPSIPSAKRSLVAAASLTPREPGNLQHYSSRPVHDPLVPVQEAVIAEGGELVWRICAGEHCVEAKSGSEAWEQLQQLCRDAGVTLAARRITGPTVGPPPLPDPGV